MDDKNWFEAQQAKNAETHRTQWEEDIKEKARMAKMVSDKATFQAQVMERRAEEFQRREEERQERLAELRQFRKTERIIKRKKEFLRRLKVEEEERIRKIEEEKR